MKLKQLKALIEEGEILPNLAVEAADVEDCDTLQDAARHYLEAEAALIEELHAAGIEYDHGA